MQMEIRLLYQLVCLMLYVCACNGQYELQYRGSIQVDHAAFLCMFEHQGNVEDPAERYSLTLSTMAVEAWVQDALWYLEHPGKHLDDIEGIIPQLLAAGIPTPRQTGQVPHAVFERESLTQPSGFLFPGKRDGHVALVDVSDWGNPVYTDITTGARDTTEAWFYHRVLWRDGDGDGDMDAFTCRARVDEHGVAAEFLWFDNPGGDNAISTSPWDEVQVINQDICDIFTIQGTLSADSIDYDVTIAAGFFTDKLTVYWSTHENNLWNDTDYIEWRIIDESGDNDDHFFDAQLVDLNNDGKLDLLATLFSHTNGSLVVYEIPDDFRVGEYQRHVLAEGYASRTGSEGSGAPGAANAFYPQTNMSGKPWILMNGDDDGRGYYFIPVSEDPEDWTYQEVMFVDEGAGHIVGIPVAADVDGDGLTEVFVSVWSKGLVRVYSFVHSNK